MTLLAIIGGLVLVGTGSCAVMYVACRWWIGRRERRVYRGRYVRSWGTSVPQELPPHWSQMNHQQRCEWWSLSSDQKRAAVEQCVPTERDH